MQKRLEHPPTKRNLAPSHAQKDSHHAQWGPCRNASGLMQKLPSLQGQLPTARQQLFALGAQSSTEEVSFGNVQTKLFNKVRQLWFRQQQN